MRALLSRLLGRNTAEYIAGPHPVTKLPGYMYSDPYPYTPDIHLVQSRPKWRLLVVDEHMRPHFRHKELGEGREFRNHACTIADMSMWRKSLGKASEAIPMESKYANVDFCPIRGELWTVENKVLLELDKYKLNTVQFERKRVHLAIPKSYNNDHSLNTDYEAWMYIGIPDYWNAAFVQGSKLTHRKDGEIIGYGRIHEGNSYYPVKTYTPKNKLLGDKYYYYAPTEYNSE